MCRSFVLLVCPRARDTPEKSRSRTKDEDEQEAEPDYLDKELRAITGDAALGTRQVDKPIRVRLRDGTEEWILVHVEVQQKAWLRRTVTCADLPEFERGT